MDFKVKKISSRLFGDEEHFPFEERIFHFGVLLGIFLTAFGTVMDVYYGANILFDLVFVGCWCLTYYLSRFRGYFSIVSVISTGIVVFAFLPFIWIASGGSGSIIPYYTIIFIAIISIVLKGYFRIAMVVSMLLLIVLLILHDAYRGGSFHMQIQNNVTSLDLLLHLGIILAATAVLIIIYSNTYMKEKARKEAYAKAIEENYHQQLYYMENLEQLISRLKAERHDFNNHLGVIYGLLQVGTPEKAGAYVEKLVKATEEFQNIVNVPYSMMRAMLNYKLSAAKENKIDLRLDVRLPANLELNEFDLAVILGNLLDNAMEASKQMGETSRHLELSILYKPDYLVIHMENPVGNVLLGQDGELRSSKPDAENHGFGLRNIKYLVEKYDGMMKIASENGVFKVDIALLVQDSSGI